MSPVLIAIAIIVAVIVIFVIIRIIRSCLPKIILALLVLAAIAFAVWWYFIR